MKKLILIRHAHRDKDLGHSYDNGLSEKGLEQAKCIKKYFRRTFDVTPEWKIFSSPKKRCVETVSPIIPKALREAMPIEEVEWLSEGGNFTEKIKLALSTFQSLSVPAVVYCSHSDLLPELTHKMVGLYLQFEKGAYAEFNYHSGTGFEVSGMIQDFSFLRNKKDA